MSSYIFPSNLEETNKTFFCIDSYTVLPAKDLRDISEKATSNESIKKAFDTSYFLPMPLSGLTDNMSTTWEMIDANVSDMNASQTAVGFLADQLGALANITKATLGQTVDRNTLPMFESVSHREFTLTWEFVPRNKQEANQLMQMVHKMRKDILPGENITKVSEAFNTEVKTLTFPNIFMLSIVKDNNAEYPIKFSKDGYICDSITVDFNGGGVWMEYNDGNPSSVSLSMKLQERKRLTKDLYDQLAGNTR